MPSRQVRSMAAPAPCAAPRADLLLQVVECSQSKLDFNVDRASGKSPLVEAILGENVQHPHLVSLFSHVVVNLFSERSSAPATRGI